MNESLLNSYEREVDVNYRGESYRVRDNGTVYRLPCKRKRSRKLDAVWTFGRPCKSNGYMVLNNVPVHRIVATAFLGKQPSNGHVVDHIDTNRRNNRPENLRWVTRLENILLNPITRRRVEVVYGSIEKFFEDPSAQRASKNGADFSWMRAVTKEEAEQCREQLSRWSASGETPGRGELGEWLYGSDQQDNSAGSNEDCPIPSLTPTAMQLNWKTPSEFPLCPRAVENNALDEYAQGLRFGAVFSRNVNGESIVVSAETNRDGTALSVVNRLKENAVKEWAVTKITEAGDKLVHESIGSFFTLQGAMKRHCAIAEVPLDDSIDDYA